MGMVNLILVNLLDSLSSGVDFPPGPTLLKIGWWCFWLCSPNYLNYHPWTSLGLILWEKCIPVHHHSAQEMIESLHDCQNGPMYLSIASPV